MRIFTKALFIGISSVFATSMYAQTGTDTTTQSTTTTTTTKTTTVTTEKPAKGSGADTSKAKP